jgi:site-specific DNA recombinase
MLTIIWSTLNGEIVMKGLGLEAIGYARVSTEEQVREGVSLEVQSDHIRRYGDLYGLNLAEILIDEGRSGKDMDRPAMRELTARVKRDEVGAVVFYKLDRVGRNTVDILTFAETLKAAGVALHSVTERIDTTSAHGGFFFTLLAALAEMERRQIAERTTAALTHKKERGEWVGRPPLGYQVIEGELVPDPEKQDVTAKAKRLRRQGKSIREIARRLSVSVGSAQHLVTVNGRSQKTRYSAAK